VPMKRKVLSNNLNVQRFYKRRDFWCQWKNLLGLVNSFTPQTSILYLNPATCSLVASSTGLLRRLQKKPRVSEKGFEVDSLL